MTFILNICLYLIAQAKGPTRLKAVLRAIILSFFLFGQIGSSAHAHEHEGETHQSVCEYCILAIQEDFEPSDETDGLDGPDFLKTPDAFRIDRTAIQGSNYITIDTKRTSRRVSQYWDPARAPPIN